MPRPIPWVPPVTRTTRPPRSIETAMPLPLVDARTKQLLGYQANVRFGISTGSIAGIGRLDHRNRHVRSLDWGTHGHLLGTARRRHPGGDDGAPAGQRADRAGLVRRGRRPRRGRPRPGHARGRPARRGAGLQRRRRHQGDAAHPRLRRPDRRQQGLLRGVQGGLRVRRPGHRRGARALPRRRGRPGRQRGLHRGQRGRLLRRPRGRPRRAGRRHPPGPDGPPAPDAHALLHRPHDQGRRPGPARLRARGGPP